MFGKQHQSKDSTSQLYVSDEKDPERAYLLKECCDLLLAGGYFRARISTLSPFDRVVGGVVWSITASGVDVDVDVVFTENSTIGQKIKLADQLVRALVRMKCPHPLQSHQIQGLDYTHLFPVLQWLIRKVIEHRRLTGDLIRAQSLNNFSKSYTLPSDVRSTESLALLNNLSAAYTRPQRKYRKVAASSAGSESVESRTESTLLEYGERIQTLASMLASSQTAEEEEKKSATSVAAAAANRVNAKDKNPAGMSAVDNAARLDLERKEQARLEALASTLSAADLSTRVSGTNIGQLVGMHSAEIARATADYEERMRLVESGGVIGPDGQIDPATLTKRGQEQAFLRQVEALKRKIAQTKEVNDKKLAIQTEHEAKQSETSTRVAKETKRIGRIHTETNKLDVMETDQKNREILTQLRALVQLNESLKLQESQFKETCLQQRKEYRMMLTKLDPASSNTAATDEDDEETARMKSVEAMYTKELDTLSKLRRVLAKKNQEIALIRRRIDEVPTRAELLQFQHRFVELYALSSEKHIETKRFYELYNSINASYEFMQTEVKLLNSIIEGFPNAVQVGTTATRAEFLQKFEAILNGVEKNKIHVREEIEQTQKRKEVVNMKYTRAVDQQRLYVKLKKEFTEESMKNEKLSEMKEELEAKRGGDGQAEE